MDNQEQQYQRGFNNGYIIARHEPGLLNKIVKNLRPANSYLDGLFSGKKECEVEQSKEKIIDLRKLREGISGWEIDLEQHL